MASLSVSKFPHRAPCARSNKPMGFNFRPSYSSQRRIVAAAQRDSAPIQQQGVGLGGTATAVVVAAILAFNVYLIGEYQLLGAEVQELRARATTLHAMADQITESTAKRAVQINELKEKMDILKQSGCFTA